MHASLSVKRYFESIPKHTVVTCLLGTGFGLAVVLRVLIGGVGVSQSPVAGIVFALVLLMLCIANGLRTHVDVKVIVIGVLGAALLLVVPVVRTFYGTRGLPDGNYVSWAIVITVVALAEEAFLRGTFFDTARKWLGSTAAVITSAALFTLLHVPLYGWHIIPLDFTVGIWLGLLRVISGSWVASGIAHTVADLCSWWTI